jgi:polar amino acid transport system substrate-binding protein
MDSVLTAAADVDRPGVRIAVGAGAAYDLYLTRTLKHAELAAHRRPMPHSSGSCAMDWTRQRA